MSRWFKNRFTWIGTIIACFVALSFIFCALPAFKDLPNNTMKLPIEIVNQDSNTIGNNLSNGLQRNLPFKHVSQTTNLAAAKDKVKNQVSLVVVVPKNFTKDIQASKTPQVSYIVNDANGILQTNVNKALTNQITSQINAQINHQALIGMNAKKIAPSIMKPAMQTAMASAMKSAMMASKGRPVNQKAIQAKVTKQVTAKMQPVIMAKAAQSVPKSITINTNTDRMGTTQVNMQHQMTSMFLTMGQYLGIMIGTIILTLVFMSARFEIGKWQSFIGFQATGLISTFILALVAIGCLRFMVSFNGGTFGAMLMHNWLLDISVFEFSGMFALLCAGIPSLIIQLPLFIFQIMAGSGIIPRQAMSGFYQFISKNTPMYQGMYSSFNILGGLNNTGSFSQTLIWLALCGLVLSVLIVWVGYRGTEKKGLSNVMPFN